MCVFCPLITYAFIAHTSIGWRGAYWYVWFPCIWYCLHVFVVQTSSFETKHKADGLSKWKLVAEMDYVGLFLFIAGCVLFLVGLSWGGRQYPWRHAAVIAPIVVGIFLLVLLFVWVFNANLKYPFLPPKLFRQWRG